MPVWYRVGVLLRPEGMTTARMSLRGWRRFRGPSAGFLLPCRLRRLAGLGSVAGGRAGGGWGGGGGRAAAGGGVVWCGVVWAPARGGCLVTPALPVLAGTRPVAGED